MNKRELIKILKKNGFKQIPKRGKGSHECWLKDGIILTIPKPTRSDYDKGTLDAILKEAGLKK